ncbi:MAG: glycosyltransferase family 2 protein [Yoonia sp.]|uniref:glycosyltransferase family 2 protein n=1 Tax=Yoonia sp. TaxID=2212373 RepID=UPI0032652BEE
MLDVNEFWTSEELLNRPDVSVIVPLHNEEESVGPLHAAIIAALEPTGLAFEILLVDDGSRDNTRLRSAAIAADDDRVAVLEFRRNFGQTAAMRAGIEYARGHFLVTMDGDLQNDPADIPMMLNKMHEGYDLVVGWRINRKDKALSRKLPSKVANWLIGKVTGLPIRDNGCSLKVYRAEVIKAVPLYSDMHRFIPAMTIPMGARIAQVGVRHHARQFGESNYGLSRVFKVLLDLISIKSLLYFGRRPLSAFTFSGGVFALLSLTSLIFLGATADGSQVVRMTLTGLFGVTSVFLLLCGVLVMLAFRNAATLDGEDENRT